MGNDQSHLATLAAKMSTSSAMNPGLVFCLIVSPLALLSGASLFHVGTVWPALMFTGVGVFPIAIAGWQLIRFTRKDPDRLQRDEHVQRMFQLQHTVGIKEHDELKQVTVSGELTGNPALEGPADE